MTELVNSSEDGQNRVVKLIDEVLFEGLSLFHAFNFPITKWKRAYKFEICLLPLKNLHHSEFNSMGKGGSSIFCVVRVLAGWFKVDRGSVGAWTHNPHHVGQIQKSIIIWIHLLHKHVAVCLTHYQVIVSKENDEVKSVNLHASTLIDPLKHIQGQEFVFLGKDFFLVFGLSNWNALLGDNSGDKLLSLACKWHSFSN